MNIQIPKENSFLQSKEWADFQKSLGRKIWREEGILIIQHKLPLNKNYLFSPRCGENFLSKSFLKKIKEVAEKENSIFFKAEPLKAEKELLKRLSFKNSSTVQPQKTLILSIRKSEKELLKQMHSKTRYNIRLAERKKIKIVKENNKFEDFWRLMRKTSQRGGFKPHPKDYYRKMLEISGVELFTAIYENKIIGANIIILYKQRATYFHGASDYNYRKLMAPYLLQWEQILEAKKRGCVEYDFWGIDEKKWPGVTRFKKGFCLDCKITQYPGAYDLVFQPFWYLIYKVSRKIL